MGASRVIQTSRLEMNVAVSGVAGRPVVLLLHGFPQHAGEWDGISEALADTFHVVAPDLRGMGATAAPAEGYDAESQCQDVLALIDALGVGPVHLVSHDYGAVIGQLLALQHPALFSTHLILATPHVWLRPSLPMLSQAWRLWFQPVIASPLGPRLIGTGNQSLLRHLLTAFAFRTMPPERVESYLAPWRDPARARAGSLVYRHLVLPMLGRIAAGAFRNEHLSIPTRILCGGEDKGMPASVVDQGYAGHADSLEVVTVEGAGHYLADDRPDAVVEHIGDLTSGGHRG
ncbi:Pimeloyl-ACP methyl ester carboxylesterase [Raineyella antarctica]|uniref:Pimeloyl-ACP methyl ester carboxylesterase n=1 Tax=Raineyella antarctica TaxID=1577474 RepID=A0A1G6GNB9_9ACTN|nr:alpha/beta hydrolase [Raineyella antarctica]SDB82676.1 Pimeloyl-ACP methyl ester carboxylesterase [Raineyella antarctica]